MKHVPIPFSLSRRACTTFRQNRIFVHKYFSADEHAQSQLNIRVCAYMHVAEFVVTILICLCLHANSLAECNQLSACSGYALKCSFFTTESDILSCSRVTDQSAADAAD